MKKLLLPLLFLLTFINLSAQNKYAIIFTRLASASGEEKVIARNNLSIIKEGLLLQGFSPSRIVADTTLLTKEKFWAQLQQLTQKIKQRDFVFLYFDIPFGIEPGTPKNELKLVLDPGKPGEFVQTSELSKYLSQVGKKINNPSMFFALFDSDSPPADSMTSLTTNKFSFEEGDYTNIVTAVSPGEKSYTYESASVFAKSVTKALSTISNYDLSYRGFFNSIKREVLLFTTKQNPQFAGSADMMLFNGLYVKFLPHFNIIEKKNDSIFVINAGERMNIAGGSSVRLYKSFSDTNQITLLAEGVITSTTGVTSVVKLNKAMRSSGEDAWAYIPKVNVANIKPTISFNETYRGSTKQLTIFSAILAELRIPHNAVFTKFVKQGGDLQVGNIVQLNGDSLEVTLINPQSGQIYIAFKIKNSSDLSEIASFTKKLAQYDYISKLTNFIPGLSVDFKMTDKNGNPLQSKENGYDILYETDEVAIQITNPNASRLYYNIIDLTQDKNYVILTGEEPMDYTINPFSTLTIPISISPPFGKERIKLLTSLAPISMSDFRKSYTRVANYEMNFDNINIQDYDFEARSLLYAKKQKDRQMLLIAKIKPGQPNVEKKLVIQNPSSERIYFNLFHQLADGSYQLIFPNKTRDENNCYVEYATTNEFPFTNQLAEYDQLLTVYADRPFNLMQNTNADKQLNDLFADIARNGRIPGTPLNKIGLVQELYLPQVSATASRDGESVLIKLVTPKASNERGLIISAPTQNYDINGFAMCTDNKPVKALKINGNLVNYDTNLKFFENTVTLSYGINKIVIEAIDEKGFTATRILELELKNNNSIVAVGKGKSYFLGIGIDAYKTWPVLNNAKNDIVKFSELLKSKYGFDSTFLLLDDQATRKNIIYQIREFLKKTGPNDNVVIYLSGHGNEDQLNDGDYYFIPQEADADDVSAAVKSTDIVDNFKKIKGKRCLLIVDACYSGMITNSVNTAGQPITSSGDQASAENAPSKWIITSGRATKVSDGEKGKNSPFATVLINYLRDHDDNASLKMSRLIDFLKEKVKEISKQQEPLGLPIEGRGEWIFKVPGK